MNNLQLMPTDELSKLVSSESAKYYKGEPTTLTDPEWDSAFAELKSRDPSNEAVIRRGTRIDNSLSPVTHETRMLSLENAKSEDDISAWVDQVAAATAGRTLKWLVTSFKLDGLSIQLSYRKGRFIRAATRGDVVETGPQVGEDVTENVKRAHGFVPRLSEPWDIDVRCEAVIPYSVFDQHFKGASNPRNSAAGTIRRKDGQGAEHVHLIAFKAAIVGSPTEDQFGLLDLIKNRETMAAWGFDVVEYQRIPFELSAVVDAWSALLLRRPTLPVMIDGMVVEINNLTLSDSLGVISCCPKGARACKWDLAETAEATVTGWEHSVGRTGVITPVLNIEPTSCGGVTVTNINLMNWDEIGRFEVGGNFIGVGSVVVFARSGDVIPRVNSVKSSCNGLRITRPAICPSCNEFTTIDGPRQICTNPSCPAQKFRSIYHWAQGRNIKHLGPETLNKLVDGGLVSSVSDLYRLSAAKLATVEFGQRTADRIMQSIDGSRTCSLVDLFGYMGIQGVQSSLVGKLVESEKCKTVDDVIAVSESVCKNVIGDVRGSRFYLEVQERADEFRELGRLLTIPVSVEEEKAVTEWTGRSFAVTGKSSIARPALVKILEAAGGIYKTSIVRGLSFLITETPDSGSSKNRDAQAKGVTVIGEQQALDMAGYK